VELAQITCPLSKKTEREAPGLVTISSPFHDAWPISDTMSQIAPGSVISPASRHTAPS